jgi:hypothetical protein
MNLFNGTDFMKKNKKLMAIAFLAISLSSCIRYQPPVSGPTATIGFSGAADGTPSYYTATIFRKPYSCESPIAAPNSDFKIPAEKLFTFVVAYEDSLYSCSIATSFIPSRDQKYIVSSSMKNGKCFVNVSEKLNSGSPRYFGSDYLPVNIKIRKYVTDMATPSCKDKIFRTYKK